LRENTERPETLEVGSNILAGTDPERIFQAAKTFFEGKKSWTHPFGEGKAAQKILDVIIEKLGK
jgi:UDP-N-acetylglucosamine 2-epimerase (non-hydrolysing)